MIGVGLGVVAKRRYSGFPPPLRSFWQRVRDDGGTMYDYNAAIAAYRLAPTASLVWAASASKEAVDYSVLPADGSGDFTYSGGGNAVSQRPDGLWQVGWAANTPRNSYLDGVLGRLVEPQRQLLLTYPRTFSNGAWTKSESSVVSGFSCPFFGTDEGFKLVESNANSIHYVGVAGILMNNNSFSVFAKKGERNWILLTTDFSSTISGNGVYFNLDAGVKGAVGANIQYSEIVHVYDGWYRCSIRSNSGGNPAIFIASNNTVNSYQGNGTSGVFICHAQAELGATSTSPIYGTEGGTRTRQADDNRVDLPSGVTEVQLTNMSDVVTTDETPSDPYVMALGTWKKIIMI